MSRMFSKGVVVGAITSTVVLMAATAFAGTGIGAVFNLGQTNTVNATSTLTGSQAGAMLQVTNTSTGTGASGIGINVASGKPPLAVNSTTKVPSLNVDLLDGRDSTYFVPASTVRRIGPINVSFSSTPTLATIGQLTFTGECDFDTGSLGQQVKLEIKSSADHAAYADLTQQGTGGTFGNGNMGAGTQYVLAATPQTFPTVTFTPVTGEALSADGHEVFYELYMGQNVGGVPPNFGDIRCVFGGSFVVK
jgi:hypothetical protein